MKKSFIPILIAMMLSSCADEKTFTINNKEVVVEPYGWYNHQTMMHDSIIYEPVIGNIVWSVILIETIVAPVYFTGWAIMEPVKKKESCIK
jgi:hypothetical protein